MELVTGLFMGDGTIDDRDSREHPSVVARMTNQEFTEWFSEELGPFATQRFVAEGSEWAERQKEQGAFKGSEEGYSDVYEIRVTSHPDLGRFREWIGDDGKKFPENLELGSTAAKVWYCCDGHLDSNEVARIGAYTEIDREEYLSGLFDKRGITPSFYWNEIYLGKEDTNTFFDWIGKPVPGFEFKWP
jgi:hypothetical protein